MSTESQEYLASKAAQASYRPKGYGISPGLQRARLRFRIRNTITGVAVASFVVGIWAYSISAVKQDVFDDVDEEARALNASTETKQRTAAESTGIANDLPRGDRVEKEKTLSLHGQDASISNRPRGIVFAALGHKYPWLFEPTHKTLIWGAPPVDNPGRIQDKIVVAWKR